MRVAPVVNVPVAEVVIVLTTVVPSFTCTVAAARGAVPAWFCTVPLIVKYAGVADPPAKVDVLKSASFALPVTANVPVLAYVWLNVPPAEPIDLVLPSPQSMMICNGSVPPVVVSRQLMVQVLAVHVHVPEATGVAGFPATTVALLVTEPTIPAALLTVSLTEYVPAEAYVREVVAPVP